MADSRHWAIFVVLFLGSFQISHGIKPAFFVQLFIEPVVIDLRIRISSVINEAGLGLGGVLTQGGQGIHKYLTDLGNQIEQSALHFANELESKGEHNDLEQLNIIYREWQEMKRNGTPDLNRKFKTYGQQPDEQNRTPLQLLQDILAGPGGKDQDTLTGQVNNLSPTPNSNVNPYSWLGGGGSTTEKPNALKQLFDKFAGKKEATTESPLQKFFDSVTGKKETTTESPLGSLLGKKKGSSKSTTSSPLGSIFKG